MATSDPMCWLPQFLAAQVFDSALMTQAYLDRSRQITWCVRTHSDGAVVGCVTLDKPLREIEYWIGSPHWRQGYCRQAVGIAIQEVRRSTGWPLLFAQARRDNERSHKVLLRNGFRFVDLQRGARGAMMLRYAVMLQTP